MTNKDIALQYLNKGLSVIPLVSPSMVSGNPTEEEVIYKCKRALVKWAEFQDRHPTEDEVNAWWDEWPDANIGIVTGKISNLVVFDVDKQDAIEYAEEEGGFPITVKATSGKGCHIYVQYPEFEVRNSTNTDLGLDIRGDGGYIVAPPSIHGSGRQYEWAEGYSIHEIDPAPCEQWMEYFLKEQAKRPSKPAKEQPPKPSDNPDTASNPPTNDLICRSLEKWCSSGEQKR